MAVNLDCAASVTARESATSGSECAPAPPAIEVGESSIHRYATKQYTPNRFGRIAASSHAPADFIWVTRSEHHPAGSVVRSTHGHCSVPTPDALATASRSMASNKAWMIASELVFPEARPLDEAF